MLAKGSLVVSCQAREDNPLHGPLHMAAMARAAAQGGAAGIRANGADDVRAIRAVVTLPVIGLCKREDDGFPVYITPDFDNARDVVRAGADIVAIDATARPRRGDPVAVLIARIRDELGAAVLADVASVADGLAAEAAGAAYVATTLSGYVGAGPVPALPDLELLAALLEVCAVPVIAEGRYDTPALAARAFALGAHAVVVGTAITNPREITRRFVGR